MNVPEGARATGGRMTTKPASTCSMLDTVGRIVWRSEHGQVPDCRRDGLSVGSGFGSEELEEQGQHPPHFAGGVAWLGIPVVEEAFAFWSANKQHQPCGNAKSRLQ